MAPNDCNSLDNEKSQSVIPDTNQEENQVEVQYSKPEVISSATKVPQCRDQSTQDNQKPAGTTPYSRAESEDSLQKLEREAIHIGEILGISVVQPDRMVPARITRSRAKTQQQETEPGTIRSSRRKGSKQ